MAFPTTEDGWKERAAHFLKEQLEFGGVTYELLAHELRRYGFEETVASVTMKLKRGSFSAAWFLACMAAIGACGDATFAQVENLRLDGKIPHHRRRRLFTLQDYLESKKGR